MEWCHENHEQGGKQQLYHSFTSCLSRFMLQIIFIKPLGNLIKRQEGKNSSRKWINQPPHEIHWIRNQKSDFVIANFIIYFTNYIGINFNVYFPRTSSRFLCMGLLPWQSSTTWLRGKKFFENWACCWCVGNMLMTFPTKSWCFPHPGTNCNQHSQFLPHSPKLHHCGIKPL